MSNPFLGQVQAFGFGVVPKGWLPCNGQLLPINSNQALFSLLATTYGGDGKTTFALPNLQGRTIVSQGTNFTLGQAAGEASHTLLQAEMPSHNHTMIASSASVPTTAIAPVTGNFPGVVAAPAPGSIYGMAMNTTLGPGSNTAGGGQPHSNMQPFLSLNFCIAVVGIFPSRN